MHYPCILSSTFYVFKKEKSVCVAFVGSQWKKGTVPGIIGFNLRM